MDPLDWVLVFAALAVLAIVIVLAAVFALPPDVEMCEHALDAGC